MHLTGLLGMPRRVYTYPVEPGLAELNFVSTVGAAILAVGIVVFFFDVLRPRRSQPLAERNPWNAGTLEWLADVPDKPWGVRSIPEIDSRYPLWDQPNFVRDVDEGRFYLPDAEEGKRETLVTSPVDAKPTQCLRVPGPTFLTLWTAIFTGGVFIFSTFHMWWPAVVSGVLAIAVIVVWLWTGTAIIPEKETKDIGLGLTVPIYVSGAESVGWWAMLITMLGDITAFVALVFGYFFYWTSSDAWPPAELPSLGWAWPAAGLISILGAWVATLAARHFNRRDQAIAFYTAIAGGVVFAIAGGVALLWGPHAAGLDPTRHTYAATVWLLLIWTSIHAAVGVLMQLYCGARRLAGRMDDRHDAEICNVSLFWHFVALTAVVTVAVVAGFPEVV